MNCFKCGSVYYENDKYCAECGVKLENLTPSFNTQTGMNIEDVRSSLGLVYFKMGKFEQALTEYEKVLEYNPQDANALDMVDQIKAKLS